MVRRRPNIVSLTVVSKPRKVYMFVKPGICSMKDITPADFKKEASNGNVVLYFTASWCQPCKVFGPLLAEESKNYSKVKFLKLDVDSNQEVAATFSVMSVPTIVFLKDGRPKDEMVGAVRRDQLKDWIEKNLK